MPIKKRSEHNGAHLKSSARMMRIDVVTIFPDMFGPVLGASIVSRAQEGGFLKVIVRDLRDHTRDKHRTVDDRPYGGGPGMLMKPEPLVEAVEAIRKECRHAAHTPSCQVVLMSPQGDRLDSGVAESFALCEHLIILCGHYEGIDERVRQIVVDRSISIGDYVLTGGELPAMVVIDAVSRFIPGVIGHADATKEESFAEGWLEYPQYTRPWVFRRLSVPEVLRSGDHKRIARWRKIQSVGRTVSTRPDLIKGKSSARKKTKG